MTNRLQTTFRFEEVAQYALRVPTNATMQLYRPINHKFAHFRPRGARVTIKTTAMNRL